MEEPNDPDLRRVVKDIGKDISRRARNRGARAAKVTRTTTSRLKHHLQRDQGNWHEVEPPDAAGDERLWRAGGFDEPDRGSTEA